MKFSILLTTSIVFSLIFAQLALAYYQPGPCYYSQCYQPCSAFVSVQVSPTSISSGQSIYISGWAYASLTGVGYPSATVYLYLDDSYITTVTTGSDGFFSYNYIVPYSTSTGTHTIRADAAISGCGSNSATNTFYVSCQTCNCGFGYCPGCYCSPGEIRNRVCDSSTTVRYDVCQSGNYWNSVVTSCPSGTYCYDGYCSYSYYPCSGYSCYHGYTNLAVNVRDCSTSAYLTTTVTTNPYYAGMQQQYSTSGTVIFYNLPQGTYTITASSAGYDSKSATSYVGYGQTNTVDICLSKTKPAGTHCLKVEKFYSDPLVPESNAEVKAEISNCGTLTENDVKYSLKMFGKTQQYSFASIGPNEQKTAIFSVSVPSDASGTEKARLQITNEDNNVAVEKTFDIAFGIPLVSVKSEYEVKRCEVDSFTFDLLNVGKGTDTFTLSLSGDAAKWLYLSSDKITIEPKENKSATVYSSVPCGTDLGKYSFTMTAKGSPQSAATTYIKVVDPRGWTGYLVFTALNLPSLSSIIFIIWVLILIALIAALIWFLTRKPLRKTGAPEKMCECR